MIECGDFRIRKIKKTDYRLIHGWFKSEATVTGFVNLTFASRSLADIAKMVEEAENKIIVIVETAGGMPIGALIINLEWENRNTIIDIIMAQGNYAGLGIGFKAVSQIIKYCKDELNLRRIEIKVAHTNKVMMKLFRFFPKDETVIEDFLHDRQKYETAMLAYFNITYEEYARNEADYVIRYLKEVIIEGKPDVVLKREGYINGNPIDLCVNSFFLSYAGQYVDDLLLLASGDFKKSVLFKKATGGQDGSE